MRVSEEHGFTLIETMVAILLFSILSIGFYQVMRATISGSSDASDISGAAEEARLGFNRMIRDTRETTKLVLAEDTRYRIWTDFDSNGVVDDDEYEYLEYAFDAGTRSITLTALSGPGGGDPDLISGTEGPLAGTETERLAGAISRVGAEPVFQYVSNFLIYDGVIDGVRDGETSMEELEEAAADGILDGDVLDYVSDVNYAFNVSAGESDRPFYGQAQIRNRRFSDL